MNKLNEVQNFPFRRLYYMGLESYESRYTLQLTQWSVDAFQRRNLDYVIVPGATFDDSKAIITGQVLDAHGRSYFSLHQMANLVAMMRRGEVTGEDVIFFEDMFTPGIESLPYIMNQIPEDKRPRVFVRCLAQAIDPDDFVHVWGMAPWMSKYEHMVNDFATVLATNEEMVAHMKVAGWTGPIYNISGLAFGKREVQSRVGQLKPFEERKKRVCFAARWDQEKQPWFFMRLAQAVFKEDPEVEFAVLTGTPELRSNLAGEVESAQQLSDSPHLANFKIYTGLKKNDYYAILNDSRVLFNCALQDWVSNTVSEADALGANVVYPAYRSFPETFANDHTRLYVPWSLEDALEKTMCALKRLNQNSGRISDWTNGTIDRCVDIMSGQGEQWRRDNRSDYRNLVSGRKY